MTAPLPMRPFLLVRHEDHTGTSGTGVVAQGVAFGDQTTVIRWCCPPAASTCVYASPVELLAIHGHDGATEIEWLQCIDATNGYLAALTVDSGDPGSVVTVARSMAGGFDVDDRGDVAHYLTADRAMADALVVAGWHQVIPGPSQVVPTIPNIPSEENAAMRAEPDTKLPVDLEVFPGECGARAQHPTVKGALVCLHRKDHDGDHEDAGFTWNSHG